MLPRPRLRNKVLKFWSLQNLHAFRLYLYVAVLLVRHCQLSETVKPPDLHAFELGQASYPPGQSCLLKK